MLFYTVNQRYGMQKFSAEQSGSWASWFEIREDKQIVTNTFTTLS